MLLSHCTETDRWRNYILIILFFISSFANLNTFCVFSHVYDISVDLLRIEKTSGGVVRERTKCKINKVMIGSVSIITV